METINLITKYRPQTFDDVIGHPAVVRSLQQICKRKDAHAFLFSGPYGTGKTTFARLVAKAYGCEATSSAILEIDAATVTGIDSMRYVQELLRYRPFAASGMRAVILDEAHGLSKQAFDSLLKNLEEPAPHVVWILCTTNPGKIPKTLVSRCATFDLKLVDTKFLGQLYDDVVEKEKLKIPDGVADVIIKEAHGSPRQLLSNIVVACTAKTKEEAAELLKTVVEDDATIGLCRAIVDGTASWSKFMGLLVRLEGQPAESIRIVIVNYLAAVLANAKHDEFAGHILGKLDAFATPYAVSDGKAPLMLSIGRALPRFSE